jgi:hypothetical protein
MHKKPPSQGAIARQIQKELGQELQTNITAAKKPHHQGQSQSVAKDPSQAQSMSIDKKKDKKKQQEKGKK